VSWCKEFIYSLLLLHSSLCCSGMSEEKAVHNDLGCGVGVEKGRAVSSTPPRLATADYRGRASVLRVCVITDISHHCTYLRHRTLIVGRGFVLTLLGGASVEVLAIVSLGGHVLKLICIMLWILGRSSLYAGGSRQMVLEWGCSLNKGDCWLRGYC
jgi:hypothetical protein